jgi:hypothetical protein
MPILMQVGHAKVAGLPQFGVEQRNSAIRLQLATQHLRWRCTPRLFIMPYWSCGVGNPIYFSPPREETKERRERREEGEDVCRGLGV